MENYGVLLEIYIYIIFFFFIAAVGRIDNAYGDRNIKCKIDH